MRNPYCGRSTLLAVLVSAVAACGGKDTRPLASADLGAPTSGDQSASQSASRDACGLILRTEAESIVGNALQLQRDTDSRTCDYLPTDGSGAGFSLKVYWSAGQDELATTKAAMGFAPKLMKQQEHMETAGMMALEPIDGLGDEAYYNPIVGSYVLKGDRLLEFDLRLLAFGQPQGTPREKWLALARKAVDRM
jgi:hypothetical protein